MARIHAWADKPVYEVSSFLIRKRDRSSSSSGGDSGGGGSSGSSSSTGSKAHEWELVQGIEHRNKWRCLSSPGEAYTRPVKVWWDGRTVKVFSCSRWPKGCAEL